MKTFTCRECKSTIFYNGNRDYKNVLCSSCDGRANTNRRCIYCDRLFTSLHALIRHRRKFHDNEIKRY